MLPLVVVMALGIAACDGEGAELTTTSVLITEPTDPADASPAATDDGVATTTTSVVRGQAVDSYVVVGRESGDDGETMYIVIPPGAYTDVDLENFILDLYEFGTATYGAEVFDDRGAADAYLIVESERTEEESELIAEHHFVSLIEGSVIRFQGPFSPSGEYPIGS